MSEEMKKGQSKIQETQARLKEQGYFASEELSKYVALFENAGKGQRSSIPSMFLTGKSGAGKTFLAEAFAKMIKAEEKFVQCFPRMGMENFYKDLDADTMIDKQVNGGINAEIIVKALEFYAKANGKEDIFYEMFDIERNKQIKEEDLRDNRQVTQMGILLQALETSKKEPAIITIDELDKARPEVDTFLLDFLENGRITTGTETFYKGPYPIYCVITSNGKREIDEALKNRSRKVEVPRPKKELFLEILGLPEDHYLSYVYDKCPDFSIRQAKQYIEDLEFLEVEIDKESLSQYINLDDLDVMSMEDLQKLSEIQDYDLEFELPELERCSIQITEENSEGWIELFKSEHKGEFELEFDNDEYGDYRVYIDNIEQLKIAKQYIKNLGEDYDNKYSGWFEYTQSEEEFESENVIYAENKNTRNKTRFGLKIDGDRMFRIATSKGVKFVFLNSKTEETLENFLGQEKQEENEEDLEYAEKEEYETDLEYAEEENYR